MAEPKKSPAWKIAIAIPAVLIGAWAGITLSQYGFDYWRDYSENAKLAQASNDLNKTLPRLIDIDTRMDTTFAGSSRNWHYRFTLVHVQPGQMTAARLNQLLRQNIVEGYRNGAGMAAFRDDHVTLVYEYYDAKGGHIGDITVGPDDLKNR